MGVPPGLPNSVIGACGRIEAPPHCVNKATYGQCSSVLLIHSGADQGLGGWLEGGDGAQRPYKGVKGHIGAHISCRVSYRSPTHAICPL